MSLAALYLCLASLPGQTMTFELRVADPIIAPGEVQMIEIWTTFAPYPSLPCPNCPGMCVIRGLAEAASDLVSLLNGDTGMYHDIVQSIFLPLSKPGVPDSAGNVLGITGYQTPPENNPYFQYQNPILIWSATWTPDDYQERTIELRCEPEVVNAVWGYCPALQKGVGILLEGVATDVSFKVVPAPASAFLVMAGIASGARRRERKRV